MADSGDERIRMGRVALGGRIRSIRVDADVSLAGAAEGARISYSYLSDVERGRRLPTLEVLDALAQVLGTTVSALLVGLYPWDEAPVPEDLEPPPDGRARPASP